MFLRGLLGSFPYRITGPAARSNRVGPLHFVPGKSQESLLISLVPIRERTALDVKVKRMIHLADRVRAKVAEGSLHNCFVFLRRTLQTVAGREFGKSGTQDLHRYTAVGVEHDNACWIGTKWVEFAAILALAVG